MDNEIIGGVTGTPIAPGAMRERIVDQTYEPESENAQSGKAVAEALKTVNVDLSNYYTEEEIVNIIKPTKVIFSDGATITVEDNTEYVAESEISTLTVIYPETDFICSFNFTLVDEGDITIIMPTSKYIGGTPSFLNGENWELNIKNGIVVGGLIE